MRYPILAIAAIALMGCEVVDTGTDVLARGIDEACERGMTTLAIEGRKEIVREINEKTTIGNHTPSDCDSDGLPDFVIDANGIPIGP